VANKKLTRNIENKVIGGVCSGLSDYFGVDSLIVRLGFLFSFLFFGAGPLVYLILWILVPKK